MRKLKSIVGLFCLLLIAGCSSDDDSNGEDVGSGELKLGIVTVEVVNTGSLDFKELVGIQITSPNTNNTTILGSDWDNITDDFDYTKMFTKYEDAVEFSDYQSSEGVNTLTFGVHITPNETNNEEINMNIIYYVDGEKVDEQSVSTITDPVQITTPIIIYNN